MNQGAGIVREGEESSEEEEEEDEDKNKKVSRESFPDFQLT